MHWFGLGPSAMEARLREVEIFFRRISRVSRVDPEGSCRRSTCRTASATPPWSARRAAAG